MEIPQQYIVPVQDHYHFQYYYWSKDGHVVSLMSLLTIYNNTESDSGNYTCYGYMNVKGRITTFTTTSTLLVTGVICFAYRLTNCLLFVYLNKCI